jgi:hypothetical protein
MEKEIIKLLEELNCPNEVQCLILATLREVRTHQDKPISLEIQNTLHKEINKVVKDED